MHFLNNKHMKINIQVISKLALLICMAVTFAMPSGAFADVVPVPGGGGGGAGTTADGSPAACLPGDALCSVCQSNNASPSECGKCTSADCADSAATCDNNSCDLIRKYVNPFINVFSVIFGLVAVISLILGGINYTTSEGDPQKTSRAKSRIANTIFAILGYIFLYSFLQFIVPGGVFNR
jgi:hypothetical protein